MIYMVSMEAGMDFEMVYPSEGFWAWALDLGKALGRIDMDDEFA